MKVVCNFKINNDSIELFPGGSYRAEMLYTLQQCEKEYNSYCAVEIKKPYKSRSTGKGSQNNKFYVMITEIANEIGEDIESVKHEIKMKAISKGYPYHVSKISGQLIPESTTKINTVEMSYLIDTCYEVGAFLGITFDETGD